MCGGKEVRDLDGKYTGTEEVEAVSAADGGILKSLQWECFVPFRNPRERDPVPKGQVLADLS